MAYRPMMLTLAAAAVALATGASAQDAGDRAFIRTVIKIDNSEILLGHLGQTRGASQPVRDYAGMLVADHTQHRAQAAQVAEGLGVKAPDGLAPGISAEKAKLEGLTGPAFDHEFARFMDKAHGQAIVAFQKEVDHGHGAAADLARQTLPTLHKHQDTAKSLEG